MKDSLDKCREKGSRHAAYGWSVQQTYNKDSLYSEEQWRAYLEGYYGHTLTGYALEAEIDSYIADLVQRWADEKEAQLADGRPLSHWAPGGFGP